MASAEVASPSQASILESKAPPKRLRNIFTPPPPDKCTRCDNRVYQMEKIGPVNEVIFHKQCFKCCQCGQHLTLKTYFTNQDDFGDREIYCSKHCPKVMYTACVSRPICTLARFQFIVSALVIMLIT